MITLTWRAGEHAVTEQFSAQEQFQVGQCPEAIQLQATQHGAAVLLTIETDQSELTIRHAMAVMTMPLLHVIVRTTQQGQAMTYVTEASETSMVDLTIETDCTLPHSNVTIECCLHTQQRQSLAVHTRQVHTVPHTSSDVVIRGVGEGTSKAFVDSIITIPHGVVGVKADQVHKHLLLDAGARAYSDPKLEVSNDDVSCSHGAAIRHCDEEQLFFLKARGIDEQTARKTVLAAFLRQKIEIDDGTLSV